MIGAWKGYLMTEVKAEEYRTDREKELEEKLGARTLLVVLLGGLVFVLLLVIAQLAR